MQLSLPKTRQRLIHGTADDVIPPAFSRDYATAKHKLHGHQREDVHLLEISGAGHYDLIDPRSKAWEQVQKTVHELTA